MRAAFAAGLCLWLCLLAGCEVGPDYRKPKIATGAIAPRLIGAEAAAFDPSAPLPPNWWRLYDDPELNALEQRALTRNNDLKSALASLEEAQAALSEVQAERTPQTSLSANPEYGQASADAMGYPQALEPSPVYQAMESISYDLDLFGRLKRSAEADRADVGAAQADLDYGRVNIAAETAEAYAGVCADGLQIVVARRSVATAQQSLYVTQREYQAGLEGINNVVRQRTLVEQTAAMIPKLVAEQRSELFMLATLTGDPPEAFPVSVSNCVSPPVIRAAIPVGDGAALLARRPDVREAERKLAAAVAEIGVSTADLYPSIKLGGSFGTTAIKLSHITEDRAFTWDIGPMITWSFPNISVARAEVASSNAEARAALAEFDGTILTALRETEAALTTLAGALDTEQQLTAARADAEAASVNTARLYQGGIGEFLDTISAEQTLISADNSLAEQTAQVAQDQVSLFMALGGGWQDAPAVDEPALHTVTR